MNFNFLAVAVAGLIPTIVGFIWYHPKVFGTAWMKLNNFTDESLKQGNFAVIMLVALLLSFILAFNLNFVVVHQTHVYSTLQGLEGLDNPATELGAYYADFMAKYGSNFRTFKHGALHGLLASIFFVLPIIAINALFERRGWKYIMLHFGYWAVTITTMGAIISGWV
jgi:hypothetical protein